MSTKCIGNFKIVSQYPYHNLCWAAVALSVDQFLNPASTWTLCQVVQDTPVNPGQPATAGCCNGNNLSLSACDHLGNLLTALQIRGLLPFAVYLSEAGPYGNPPPGPTPIEIAQGWATIKNEIDNGRVLCCGIAWQGGGWHFVVICNYNEAAQTVCVQDPWFDPTPDMPYQEFASNYLNRRGVWTEIDRIK
jgi:hypothetical protein